MRIISGKYKGKILKGFQIEGTRPTMDRVKESLFGMIQNYIPGSVCLDLFAGSGALGIEALSNGAEKCYFIDHNSIVIKTLQQNLKQIEGGIIIKEDYQKFLNTISDQFDIIFLDPPYQDNLISICLKTIEEKNLLSPSGIVVCEYESEIFESNMTIIKEKKYGSKWIRIYKK